MVSNNTPPNSEFQLKTIAASVRVADGELQEALEILGFSTRSALRSSASLSKSRQIWVSGTIENAIISDGKPCTAPEVAGILAALATEYGKSIKEIAQVAANHKDGGALAIQESSEIELDEVDSQVLNGLAVASQIHLRREVEENRKFAELAGIALEADRVRSIQIAREQAWQNPASRAALEQLIRQGSQESMNLLMGKSAKGKTKITSIQSLLNPSSGATVKPAETMPTQTPQTLEVPDMMPNIFRESSVRTPALPSGLNKNEENL